MRDPCGGDDGPREVRNLHDRVVGAGVDGDHIAERRAEAEETWARARSSRQIEVDRRVDLIDVALGQEQLDELLDRRHGEPRGTSKLGSRQRALRADDIEH